MREVLCIYYSRTGNTKRAMEEISADLGAELVEIRDAVDRTGTRGYFRCGLDAVRQKTAPLSHFETDQPLESYRLVIVGTPVWAGRCSAITRAFLKAYGNKLPAVAYVLTRGGENRYEDVYRQMDLYTAAPHCAGVSLRSGSVGCHFWQEEFLRQVRAFLEEAPS